jgi:hypothetical protein
VNPRKCKWFAQEVEWLGYVLTPNGYKPQPKKTKAILAFAPPKNQTQLRAFCSLVTFYRDSYPQRAHRLAPLTALEGKKEFKWTHVEQKAFEDFKQIAAHETLLAFPDPSQPFHIFTDASDYQLGSIIKQNNVPLAYFSRKLTSPQRRYTTIEKELLSIVETLKEFRQMLYGAQLIVHTDHKNLTYTNLNSERVLRWRLLLEEFHIEFKYIEGPKNKEADALSRLPLLHDDPLRMPDDAFLIHPIVDDPETEFVFPLHFALLASKQLTDTSLSLARQQHPDRFFSEQVDGNKQLWFFKANPESEAKIYIPAALVAHVIHWYHLRLNHIGSTKIYKTIAQHFYAPNLQSIVNEFVRTCEACQKFKLPGKGYGHLPPRDPDSVPWNDVCIHSIGPWSITVNGQPLVVFRAITATDPVTGLTEAFRVADKTDESAAMRFENEYLSRYPRPLRCIHDQGGEFIGDAFLRMLLLNGIESVPITAKNPTANSIAERVHQTVENCIRTYIHNHPPTTAQSAENIVDSALATATYAVRTAVHRTTGISPGALAFHRDMLLPIPIIADLDMLRQKRQALVDKNLLRQNLRRIRHDYTVGDEVLILDKNPNRNKLSPLAHGPFVIQQVHTNGTVTILRSPNIYERLNIRRLRPFFRSRISKEEAE